MVTSPRVDDGPALHWVDHNYFSLPNVQPHPDTDELMEAEIGLVRDARGLLRPSSTSQFLGQPAAGCRSGVSIGQR
ncbi:MAG: hypothetical protein JRI23_30845 [Deltaproteobacteria bacterium]|nr:hypothetical protein [Deltaproteobacteria bacterium]MBW2536596.1 hypothetical protein [Deltaproteobacteria bacterium]